MKPTLQSKGKSRKGQRLLAESSDGASRPDLSSLRKPIDTSLSDLYQVSDLLKDSNDEVKSILSYECSAIYECRVCHSAFRSIVNLVSHKREYCREKFDGTLRRRVFHKYNHSARESIVHMYKTEQSNDSVKNDKILRSQVSKKPNKKDFSAIIDMLKSKRQEEHMGKELRNGNAISNALDDRHVYLEAIDTNSCVVYQTIEPSNVIVDHIDLMKEQVTELQNITDQNALAIEEQLPEIQVEKSHSPIQANMDDEENELLIYRLPTNNLSCFICNAKFSTRKTLIVHVKKLHTSKRLCYPCPCCTNVFANKWSVWTHLYKVHKKTTKQVRNLRLQIQKKAFHRKTPAMRNIKNVRAAEVSLKNEITKNNDNTQEPINHIESDTKLCSRRGRRSRKASLSNYLQSCNTSVSTSDNICETEDVNLANTITRRSVDKDTPNKNFEQTSKSPEIYDHKTSVHKDISSLNKKDWDKLGNQHNYHSECNSVDNNNVDNPNITSPKNIGDSKSLSSAKNQDNFLPDENSISPGIVCTNVNEVSSIASMMRNKKKKNHHNEEQLTDSKERDKIDVREDNSLQFSCSNEKNRASLTESKIATIADFRKLRCLLCKQKFTSVLDLRRHAAIHIGWNGYRCKLCEIQFFVKCECVTHCNQARNVQNNHKTVVEMITEIPQDEYMYNEDVVMDVIFRPKTKSDNPDILMDATASSCQTETRLNSNDFNDLNVPTISLQSEATVTNERVTESCGSAECQNVDADDSDTSTNEQDLPEYMTNYRKLDDDPELKRMVMEVIFGSTDTSMIEARTDKSILETNNERVTESCGSAECQNVDADDSDTSTNKQDLPEYMTNYRKLDDDPELKRMVMEVIFGSTDTSMIEARTDKSILETNNERVTESCGSAECQNVDADDSDTSTNKQDLPEYMTNYRKLDDDPELKRMVMEVIFGSTDTSMIEARMDK